MLFLVISRAQNWPLILGHCLQWALLCTISIWKSYFISPFQKRKSCQLSALTGVGQLFLKGLHSKYFRLFGQLCQGGHLSSHRGYVNEWVWLCSKYNFIHKTGSCLWASVHHSLPLSKKLTEERIIKITVDSFRNTQNDLCWNKVEESSAIVPAGLSASSYPKVLFMLESSCSYREGSWPAGPFLGL